MVFRQHGSVGVRDTGGWSMAQQIAKATIEHAHHTCAYHVAGMSVRSLMPLTSLSSKLSSATIFRVNIACRKS